MSFSSENKSKDLPNLPAPPYRFMVMIVLAFGLGFGITQILERGNSNPVTGYLYSKSTPVVAQQTGVIQEILIQTGDTADETSSLCIVKSITLQNELVEQEKLIAQLELDLIKANAKSEIELAWRFKSLENEVLQTRLKAASYLQEKYNQQIEKYAWKKYLTALRPVGHIRKPEEIFRNDHGIHDLDRFQIRAKLEQESAQNAEEVTSVQLRLCEKRLKSLKTLKEELPTKVSESLGISIIQDKLAVEKKKIDSLNKMKLKLDVKADTYGMVGPIRHSVGETINKGEKLVDIYHLDHIFVKAFLPSLSAAKVENGSEVRLYFPNGEKRKGRIKHKSFIASKSNSQEMSMSNDDSEVEIIVEPFGKNWPKVSFGTAIQIQTL